LVSSFAFMSAPALPTADTQSEGLASLNKSQALSSVDSQSGIPLRYVVYRWVLFRESRKHFSCKPRRASYLVVSSN